MADYGVIRQKSGNENFVRMDSGKSGVPRKIVRLVWETFRLILAY